MKKFNQLDKNQKYVTILLFIIIIGSFILFFINIYSNTYSQVEYECCDIFNNCEQKIINYSFNEKAKTIEEVCGRNWNFEIGN